MNIKQFTSFSIRFLLIAMLLSCGNATNKKNKSATEDPSNESVTKNSEENDSSVPQKGNYDRLFSLGEQCKITPEEIATLYGIGVESIKETYSSVTNDGGYMCNFNLTLKDGTQSVFGLTVFKMPIADVTSQISNWKTGSYEKQFLSMSSSGDHYVWKHPNQGHFTVYNPKYANGMRLQYMTLLKKDKTQKEYLEQKGLQAIDYLIEKYKD